MLILPPCGFDLLGIVEHWRDRGNDQWALNELRRWNTRDRQETNARRRKGSDDGLWS
jgi:hypothetical protein